MVKRLTIKLKSIFKLALSNSDRKYIAYKNLSCSNLFTNTASDGDYIYTTYKKVNKLRVRNFPSSDMEVLKQVLISNEYEAVVHCYKDNFTNKPAVKIIDAGTNVGYASIYFLSFFEAGKIACVEPDAGNLKEIAFNLNTAIKAGSVTVFPTGLMGGDDISIQTNRSFRDGKDWSVEVQPVGDDTGLKSVSVASIMKAMQWQEVDIIKIDIEGAERYLFNTTENVQWLLTTKVVAIEIHDEFEIREKIYEILRAFSFIIFNVNETTIAINKKLLG
ncbi:MAG: hypothetical protein RL115_856 [Bacteroidota bacterium]